MGRPKKTTVPTVPKLTETEKNYCHRVESVENECANLGCVPPTSQNQEPDEFECIEQMFLFALKGLVQSDPSSDLYTFFESAIINHGKIFRIMAAEVERD